MKLSDAQVLTHGDILQRQDGSKWVVKRKPITGRLNPQEVDVLLSRLGSRTLFDDVWMTEITCVDYRFLSDRDGHR